MPAPHISHRMVTCLHWSMFAVAAIPVASSSRSQMNRAMGTTWWSGSRSSRFATGKWRCGVVLTPGSINGRRRKNFRRISRRSFRQRPRIRRLIIPLSITSAKPTTCNGSHLRVGAPVSRIFSAIKNSGARNFSTLTRNTLRSKRSIRSLEILPRISSASSNIRPLTRITTRWFQRRAVQENHAADSHDHRPIRWR